MMGCWVSREISRLADSTPRETRGQTGVGAGGGEDWTCEVAHGVGSAARGAGQSGCQLGGGLAAALQRG